MADIRLYKIIGGGIIVFLIVTGIMLFLSSGMNVYTVLNYNATDLEYLQNASYNFKDIAPNYDNASEIVVAPNDFDKSGSLLSQAQSALETTEDSLTFFSMISTRLGSMLHLGSYGGVVAGAAAALIVIVIILGVALAGIFRIKI